jgi:hypothetical protein
MRYKRFKSALFKWHILHAHNRRPLNLPQASTSQAFNRRLGYTQDTERWTRLKRPLLRLPEPCRAILATFLLLPNGRADTYHWVTRSNCYKDLAAFGAQVHPHCHYSRRSGCMTPPRRRLLLSLASVAKQSH